MAPRHAGVGLHKTHIDIDLSDGFPLVPKHRAKVCKITSLVAICLARSLLFEVRVVRGFPTRGSGSLGVGWSRLSQTSRQVQVRQGGGANGITSHDAVGLPSVHDRCAAPPGHIFQGGSVMGHRLGLGAMVRGRQPGRWRLGNLRVRPAFCSKLTSRRTEPPAMEPHFSESL